MIRLHLTIKRCLPVKTYSIQIIGFSLNIGLFEIIFFAVFKKSVDQFSTHALSLIFCGYTNVINVSNRFIGIILMKNVNGKSANDFIVDARREDKEVRLL